MVRASWFDEESEYRPTRLTVKRWASLVNILLIINFALFVLDYIVGRAVGDSNLSAFLGLNCNAFRTPYFFIYLPQLITYQFLHADLMHILINMLILWFFGRELANFLGSKRFLILYLSSGVVGGLCQILVGILRGDPNLHPVVGASGAIYGIVVYYALMWPNRTVSLFIFPLIVPMKVKYMAGFMVGISVLYGFVPEEGDMVAHMCHLGGAVFGFIFFRYEGRYKRLLASVKEQKDRREEYKVQEDDKEMDRLLSKIHEEGINSLTDKERKFLNEASRKYRKGR